MWVTGSECDRNAVVIRLRLGLKGQWNEGGGKGKKRGPATAFCPVLRRGKLYPSPVRKLIPPGRRHSLLVACFTCSALHFSRLEYGLHSFLLPSAAEAADAYWCWSLLVTYW